LRLGSDATGFTVEVRFDDVYPENRRFTRENIRLHCTPAVNLFSTDAEPVRVEHFDAEYHVTASARFRKSMTVYDVEEVIGLEDATAKRNTYEPYFAFRHGDRRKAERLYMTRRRAGPLDRLETYLSLTGSALDDPDRLPSETLSIRVLSTTGSLPRERLQEGSIDRLAPEAPQVVDVTNVTQPTLSLDPPIRTQDGFFWQLVSHWSFNYLSVASRDALLGLLSLYDWTGSDANKRRFAGITDVRWLPKEMPYRGGVIRGAEVRIAVQDGHFDDGELNLFGIILSRFLTLYATVNSFVHLAITLTPSGKHFEWQPPLGTMPPL
jgi:type VI secretion system protein ImpG